MPEASIEPIDVLVADDDDDVREALALVLEHEGFRVTAVADGAQALAHLRACPAPPIVLLDLRMPVLTGWQVLDRLRSEGRLPALPVIICTSSPGEAPPGFPVVPKPVALATVLAAIWSAARAR